MNRLEERLRDHLQGKADLVTVPAGDASGIRRQARRRTGQRVLGAAAALLVLGAIGWLVANWVTPAPFVDSTTTTTTTLSGAPGPALRWTQVDTPAGIESVSDLWAMEDGGFALRSVDEIWTSADGQSWSREASLPEDLFSPDSWHEVVDFAGGWLGIGAPDQAPSVFSSDDGMEWSTMALPQGPEPSNELLESVTWVSEVAAGPGGAVITGRISVHPNVETVVARFAPELAGQDLSAQRSPDGQTVSIRNAGGEVLVSIPASDIDPQLQAGTGGWVLWQSADGTDWEIVHRSTVTDSFPYGLGAGPQGFRMVEVLPGLQQSLWTSPDGLTWDFQSELPPSFAPVTLGSSLYTMDEPWLIRQMSDDGTWVTVADLEMYGELSDRLSPGSLNAGVLGMLLAVFDGSSQNVATETLWFSPDGVRWSRQDLEEVFGATGNIRTAVGESRVLLALDPQTGGGAPLQAPFALWIGTLGE